MLVGQELRACKLDVVVRVEIGQATDVKDTGRGLLREAFKEDGWTPEGAGLLEPLHCTGCTHCYALVL